MRTFGLNDASAGWVSPFLQLGATLFGFVKASIRTVLTAAEPIIRVVLLGLAALITAMALLFRYSGVAPHLPFWGMLAIAAALVVLLVLYQVLLGLLSD
jgi:hypothetical protein